MAPVDKQSAKRTDNYLNTHNTHKKKGIHTPGGIQNGYPSKRAAADPHLCPRADWYRLFWAL
jgi:hypothetical protein